MLDQKMLPPGVFAYSPPGAGQRYKWYDAEITIKISPDSSPFTHMTAWQVDLAAGKSADFFAQRSVDRIYLCMGGSGYATLGRQRNAVSPGSFIYVGRGVPFLLESSSSEAIQLTAASVPAAVEVREDLFAAGTNASSILGTAIQRSLLGILDCEALKAFPDTLKGAAYVLDSDGGDSFWQAAPTTGYVTSKTSPHNSSVYHFSSAIQLLEPGAYVREHGHQRACEMLISVRGQGRARIDGGEELDFSLGAAVLLGPRAMHTLRNCGDDDFVIFAVSTPSEIDAGLRATGMPRVQGEPRPEHIVRNPETGRILVERFGFIIPATQPDAMPVAVPAELAS